MPSVIQNKRSEKDLCLSIVSLKFPISFVTSIAVDSIVKQKNARNRSEYDRETERSLSHKTRRRSFTKNTQLLQV